MLDVSDFYETKGLTSMLAYASNVVMTRGTSLAMANLPVRNDFYGHLDRGWCSVSRKWRTTAGSCSCPSHLVAKIGSTRPPEQRPRHFLLTSVVRTFLR